MNLSEIKVPTWLSIHRHAEEVMDRIDPIPTAIIPPPDTEPQLPMVESPEVEAMKKAAATVARFEQQRQEQAQLIERATAEIKTLIRDNELLRLDLAQCQNNLATAQSQIEAFREENAEHRAREGHAYRLARHLVAEYERAEIEMPKRKPRNGKTNEASHAEKPVDRPTIQSDQAA